jgi:hypothetical protein
MESLIEDTLADARWFPLRFDVEREELHFVWVPAELQRAVTFLADIRPSREQLRIIRWSSITETAVEQAPVHFILHSGLGGSTLLSRALGQHGVVTTLKEPPILTDIIAFRLRKGELKAKALAADVSRLFARPFSKGEATVVKMSSVGNGLHAWLGSEEPTSRTLCLVTPLEDMLASLARRGTEGRTGGRKLFEGLANSGYAQLGISDQQLSAKSDLELAALAWIAIQRLMANAADRLGVRHVRAISSQQLLEAPDRSLRAIAGHFALDLDVEGRLSSGIFQRHAKSGERFDASARERLLQESMARYAHEILPIADWATKIAEANHVPLQLPYPLFGDVGSATRL